jgi:hypothetical protein
MLKSGAASQHEQFKDGLCGDRDGDGLAASIWKVELACCFA